ncbi:alpha-L-rhamnosidase-related protein [Aeoliella sp. SH292]|uniref:alpha-L-rhamnosidase-related protein n=1 Tax=Aeoliella sp. SH292 TaxID=3454464 RepID=UPI003F9A1ACE
MRVARLCSAVTAMLLVAPALPCFAVAPSPPIDLRTNDVATPTGTGGDTYFGWRVVDADDNEIQTSWQILVASNAELLASNQGDVWDSGKVASRQQNHISFKGTELQSGTRYFWKVRTWDRDNQSSSWSDAAHFDVGLLTNGDWSGAHWIRRNSNDVDDYTRFRRAFELSNEPIERAILYVSATHRFELYINGQLVGKGPAYHYPDRQYYHAYDVGKLLRPGKENLVAIRTHWFGGGQGRPAGARGLISKLVVEHTDGPTTVIGSDDTWIQSRDPGWLLVDPVQRNRGEGVGYVERIDGRRMESDWFTIDYDDSTWKPAAIIGPHPVAPWTGVLQPDLTRFVETPIQPVSITKRGDQIYVVDLGKVWAGMPCVKFEGGKSPTLVTMRGGYELNAAGILPAGTRAQSTNMEYRAVLSGKAFEHVPTEYLGMRYFQLDNPPMPVTTDNFQFIARHIALDDDASSFESSDETLNAVWDLMKHSIYTCAQEEFVDTPTREKGGFLGDAAIQSTVAMPVFGERALTQRVMREFLDSMDRFWSAPEERGRMNAVYPNNDGGRDIPDFTQAFAPWVWNYYLETGDRDFLVESWPKLKDIGGYLDRHIDAETGLVTKLTGGGGAYEFGIIDWPASMRGGYDMETDARTVINGWAIADYQALAHIAEVLGDAEGAATYRRKSATLEQAINKRLIGHTGLYMDGLHGDGTLSGNASQHANIFPLAIGMVPPELKSVVTARVNELGMGVGMVTVSWLVKALGETKQGPALVDLYTNPNQPGWARCLDRGATATWEAWNADETGNSLSHAWGAAGLEGYVRYILGIRPVKAQYELVRIEPLDFGTRLPWAKGTIATDRGPIAVHWQRSPSEYSLEVTLPVNVTADLVLPRGNGDKPVVELDGKEIAAEFEGDSIVVRGVGSGQHTAIRRN